MHPANRPQAETQMIEGRNSSTAAITAPMPVPTSNLRLFCTSSVPQIGQCGNPQLLVYVVRQRLGLAHAVPRSELIRISDPLEFQSAHLSLS